MRNVKPARVPKQRKVHKLLRFGKARCFIFYLFLGIFSLSFVGRSSEESWRRSRLDGSKPVGRPSPYIIINVILGTLVFVATPIEVDQRDTLHRIFKSKTSFFLTRKKDLRLAAPVSALALSLQIESNRLPPIG